MSNQSHSVSAAATRFSMHALTGGGVIRPASSPTYSEPGAMTAAGQEGEGNGVHTPPRIPEPFSQSSPLGERQ